MLSHQVHTDNQPRRHISFGGEARLRGGLAGLDVDSNGLLWLHHRAGITGGTEVGDAGPRPNPSPSPNPHPHPSPSPLTLTLTSHPHPKPPPSP